MIGYCTDRNELVSYSIWLLLFSGSFLHCTHLLLQVRTCREVSATVGLSYIMFPQLAWWRPWIHQFPCLVCHIELSCENVCMMSYTLVIYLYLLYCCFIVVNSTIQVSFCTFAKVTNYTITLLSDILLLKLP